TGTLTAGKPIVTDVIVREDLDEKETIQILASIEAQSNHPLAQARLKYAKEKEIVIKNGIDIKDIPGSGIQASINNESYKVGKAEFVGSFDANNIAKGAALQLADEGKTVIFLRDEKGIAALVALKDTIREEAKRAVTTLKDLGIQVAMLTGDNEKTA